MTKHLFIPDTQVKPGVNTDHLEALGHYIVQKKPDVIVHIGDHWDMPSLSSYDKAGSKGMEGRRYKADIAAGNAALNRLMAPINAYNNQQRKLKRKLYKPRKVFCMGNHEYRINRATEIDAKLDELLTTDHFNLKRNSWEVHNFLEVVNIDGINYSHYFVNPSGLTGYPLGGTVQNKLNHLSCSFSMGHQQCLQHGVKYTGEGKALHGLVCGSFYQHDEDYLGPQKNKEHWRGIIIKHEVENGEYDPMFVSMKYLMKRFM